MSEGEDEERNKLSYEEYMKKKEQHRKEKEELKEFLDEAATIKPKVRYYEETAGDKFYLINKMDWIEYEHVKEKKNIIKDWLYIISRLLEMDCFSQKLSVTSIRLVHSFSFHY